MKVIITMWLSASTSVVSAEVFLLEGKPVAGSIKGRWKR